MRGAPLPVLVRSRTVGELDAVFATAITAGAVSHAVMIGLRQAGMLSGVNFTALVMDAVSAAERETAASNHGSHD